MPHSEEPLTLRQVCRGLPSDTALVSYFTTGIVGLDDAIIQNLPSATKDLHVGLMLPARTLVFVITRAGLVDHRELALDPNALRQAWANDSMWDRSSLDGRKLGKLYDLLLAPVWDHLRDKRVLYVVPHGPLHNLPFGALRRPDGRHLLHASHPQLVYSPSATVLLRQCCGRPSAAPRSCLTLGYNEEGLTSWHQAEDEAQAVARVWDGEAWIGDGAKKARLFETGSSYRILHFACPGQFNPHDKFSGFITLGTRERLTAAEILEQLRLNADLVSLSVGKSGLSHVAQGEDLVGLVQAFMSAGASSVVVTQREGMDVSTRIVMERFHRSLAIGAGQAEALRQAQIYLQGLTIRELRQLLHDYGVSNASIENQLAQLLAASGVELNAGDSDEMAVFANPCYWAPFILAGCA